jgi:hypothetical protein
MKSSRPNPHWRYEPIKLRLFDAGLEPGLPTNPDRALKAFYPELVLRYPIGVEVAIARLHECRVCGGATTADRQYCDDCEAGLGVGD